MTILLFGNHLRGDGYPRPAVLVEGLRAHGIEVREVAVPLLPREGERPRAMASRAGLLGAVLRGLLAFARLLGAYGAAPPHDAVVVAYPGHLAVHVARLFNPRRRRPVVLDAFLSLHDTVVGDRRLAPPRSLRARALRAADRWAARAADLVMVDTAASGEFFHREFGVPRERLRTVLVGALCRAGAPDLAPVDAAAAEGASAAPGRRPLRALWFGTYVPLQGVTTVLDAVAALRDDEVRLTLVGRGQELPVARAHAAALGLGPPRVEWVEEFLARDALERRIRAADVCLGIFGSGAKALRVVPCKVYDAVAAGRPVVTADTAAAREVLTDGVDALLTPPADGAALAAALRRLVVEPALRARLREGAARLFAERLHPRAVTRALAEELCGTRPRTG